MTVRSLTVAVVAGALLSGGAPALADDVNPLGNEAHGGGHAEAAGSTFVASSTAFVDPDGTRHNVPIAPRNAPSPYEYRVKREPGFCGIDAAGQPIDLVFVDTRLVADGPGAPWNIGTAFCASPQAQPLDLGNIAAQAARVTQTLTPPSPSVRIQPNGTTLVGNPTVFSGSNLGFVQPPALVNPLSGRALQLTVQPTTWSWDFGDGSPAVTTSGPPPPYTHGASMSGLLTHTYRRAADVNVTVTVSWTASYTISGVAGSQNVANPVASTTTIRLLVRQARSQLVSR